MPEPSKFRKAIDALITGRIDQAHTILAECGALTPSQQRIWDRAKLRVRP